MRSLSFALIFFSVSLHANENGLPVGRSGGFGEATCSGAGCHRPEPLNVGRTASVRIEVGPYVPGAVQSVRLILESRSANRWGFQLTARPASGNALPAGTFEAVNQFVAVRCPDGRFATPTPCPADQPQYVTHTSVGSNPGGQPGLQTFFFDWTAPASDIGPVVFAASALGADGDRGTNNDITATTTTQSLFAPTNSPAIPAGGVTGAAAPQRQPSTISSKQLVSIFGTNLNAPGAAIPVAQTDFDPQGRLPRALGRLSILFNVPGDPRDYWGRMIFVGDRQANLQAPQFPGGTTSASVAAVINRGAGASEVRSTPVMVTVERSAPGLFTFGGPSNPWSFGEGPAAVVDSATGRIVAPAAVGAANSIAAAPGSIILLFGTGFGPINPDTPEGELVPGLNPPARLVDNVTVDIGGMPAVVLFAGPAPNFAGFTQFNIRVPASLPPGEHALFVRQPPFVTQTNVFVPVGN